MITLTDELFNQLREVNRDVNADVRYKTDAEQYRKAEYWAYPENMYGDCEDYALEKIKRLVALGWSRNELKLTTCWIIKGRNDSYHAVLTVDTDKGTFVLDNNFPRVMPIDQVDYDWHKREVPGVGWSLVELKR